jgi:hypothetical protein
MIRDALCFEDNGNELCYGTWIRKIIIAMLVKK